MINDDETIKEVLSGNIKVFEKVIIKYKDYIYNLGLTILNNHTDAEDLTQETFIKLYKNLNKFRFGANLKTFIYRIAINTAKDMLRKKRHNPTSIEEIHPIFNTSNDKLNTQFIITQIKSLPEKYSTVLILRYIEQLSYEEIAEVLKKPVGTIKTLIFRAKIFLNQKIK
ncbi:MAG: sigma-70 family RNA polymerase sigma factor [Endomicrobia bacterium]|nr:sigma-70 family RNA polymerase sigma factor [Endomicrobiia bacterium]